MKKILGIVGIIVVCALVRLFPHAPNVAPMTAFALFAGYAFGWRIGIFAAPLATFLTDFIFGFYEPPVMVAVYSSYALIAWFSARIGARKSAARAIAASWGGSLIFFSITNGAVWAFSTWYPKTVSGLLMAYTNGLPFLRNAIIGDMFYTGLFYLGYSVYLKRAELFAWLKMKIQLQTNITS